MQLPTITKNLGYLLLFFSLSMLPPLLFSWWEGDGNGAVFLQTFGIILALGTALWAPTRKATADLRLHDGFMIVVLFWLTIGFLGAIPFLLSPQLPHLGVTNAVFESFSGLTTTGATVIVGLDELPRSLLLYRQQLQWLGGMGIIILAVAVLPGLGIEGVRLYRMQLPGPSKDIQLAPRITEAAKSLWNIYVLLTISCGICYWLAGMTPFDALSHSFSTVSIGGFSTHDASMSHYPGNAVKIVATAFMLISGANYALHFVALKNLTARPYLEDPEFNCYIRLQLLAVAICWLYLAARWDAGINAGTLVDASFQAVSITTTSGFTVSTYHQWPEFLPLLLLFASFAGACVGSVGGGIKVIRLIVIFKQGLREILRLNHPNVTTILKTGNRTLTTRSIEAIWGFFAAYIAIFAILLLALVATGIDQVTAFSAVAACMNNLGPGLGAVSSSYAELGAAAKWLLTLAMLLGRLELFPILILLSMGFWRK